MIEIADSYEALKGIDPPDESAGSKAVFVMGRASIGDGGSGLFYWDSSEAGDDNDGTIIKPTGQTGTGRWVRHLPDGMINVRWFGAVGDGANNDREAIENAATAASGMFLYFPPCSDAYPVKQGDLTLPEDVTLLFAPGALLRANNTRTVTVNSKVQAAPDQAIFAHAGTGKVVLKGTVYPHWWAGGPGVQDDFALRWNAMWHQSPEATRIVAAAPMEVETTIDMTGSRKIQRVIDLTFSPITWANWRSAGGKLIDCDNSRFLIVKNVYAYNPTVPANKPAIGLSRQRIAGVSIGDGRFESVVINGHFTDAALKTAGAERQTFVRCSFTNQQDDYQDYAAHLAHDTSSAGVNFMDCEFVTGGGAAYDLRLMSVDTVDGLLQEGRSLVIVALMGADLHIRIFNAGGNIIVDKPAKDLMKEETDADVEDLRALLDPFPDEFLLSQEDKNKIVKLAISIAGLCSAAVYIEGAHNLRFTGHTFIRNGGTASIFIDVSNSNADGIFIDGLWQHAWQNTYNPNHCVYVKGSDSKHKIRNFHIFCWYNNVSVSAIEFNRVKILRDFWYRARAGSVGGKFNVTWTGRTIGPTTITGLDVDTDLAVIDLSAISHASSLVAGRIATGTAANFIPPSAGSVNVQVHHANSTDTTLLLGKGFGVGNSETANLDTSTPVNQMEVFDSHGNSIGFVALYNRR